MRTNCSNSNMAAVLQLLKSISRRRQERHDLEMQMLVTQKSESRKRKLQVMDDDEIDTAKAIGLCAVRAKRPRKERSPDEQRSSSWWSHGYRNCFALVPVVSGQVEHKCVLVYDVPSLYQTTLTSETLKSSVKCVVRTHLTEDVKVVRR